MLSGPIQAIFSSNWTTEAPPDRSNMTNRAMASASGMKVKTAAVQRTARSRLASSNIRIDPMTGRNTIVDRYGKLTVRSCQFQSVSSPHQPARKITSMMATRPIPMTSA